MGCENPDWLPEGWKISVKVRRSGKKDKYYVNPSSGLKFNSKPELLRYVKSSEKNQNPKKKNKINIEKTVAENLPPGWIKEIRTKKKGGKTRRDPYYIDPVSGRHFRSMQEVFRYLEMEDSRKAKSEPNDKCHDSVELENHSQSSSAEDKEQKSIDKKADKVLTGNEGVKSGLKIASCFKGAATNNVEVPEDKQREEHDSPANELSDKVPLVNRVKQCADRTTEIKKLADNKLEKSARGGRRLKPGSKVATLKEVDIPAMEQKDTDDAVVGNLPDKLPQVNRKGQQNSGRRQSRRLAGSKLRDNVTENQSLQSGSEDATEKNTNMLENNDLEQREENNSMSEGQEHENLTLQNKRKNSNSKWSSDLPRRTSKRLACVEVKPRNKPVASAHGSGEAEVDTTESAGKAGNPTNKQQEKPIEEHKGGLVDCKKDEKPKDNLESSLKDLLKDPCIEFAIKTLTGAIPIEDLTKIGDSPVSSLASPNQTSSSSSVLHSIDIWADPCFEFAVKTLTGDIPVEDDGSQVQTSFQQPLSTSGDTSGRNNITLTNFSLDNGYTGGYSFNQFDAVKNPFVKRQQGVGNHPFPHAISGSSQKSVDTSLHRGDEGKLM